MHTHTHTHTRKHTHTPHTQAFDRLLQVYTSQGLSERGGVEGGARGGGGDAPPYAAVYAYEAAVCHTLGGSSGRCSEKSVL